MPKGLRTNMPKGLEPIPKGLRPMPKGHKPAPTNLAINAGYLVGLEMVNFGDRVCQKGVGRNYCSSICKVLSLILMR